jgi:hypothetical protein
LENSGAWPTLYGKMFPSQKSVAVLVLLSSALLVTRIHASVVAAWGYNSAGQTTVPPSLTNATALAGGAYHSLALRADGTVAAWGDNSAGQTNVPANATNVSAISAGWLHSLALRSNGTVIAWGDNTYGQTSAPVGISFAAIAAGWLHNLALTSNGNVIAWGDNGWGHGRGMGK